MTDYRQPVSTSFDSRPIFIIDAALVPDIVTQWYQESDASPNYWPLFEQTLFAGMAKEGPHLLFCEPETVLFKESLKLLKEKPSGCLLWSNPEYDVLSWARNRLTVLKENNHQALCRYYDPRRLGAWHHALNDQEWSHFWEPVSSVQWFHQSKWHTESNYHPRPFSDSAQELFVLSQHSVQLMNEYEERQFAEQMLAYYANFVPENSSPESWINEHIVLAKDYGFDRQVDQEKWIRTALVTEPLVLYDPGLQQLLKNSRLPASRKWQEFENYLSELTGQDPVL